MKVLNNAKISVFVKENENEELAGEALKNFVPLDLEKEKIAINKKTATGFEDKKIAILEIFLQKERHTNAFLKRLSEILDDEQKEILLRQAESRLDENLNFFIRFDKKELAEKGEFSLTDSGNCFHIKMSIACFPKKREKALEIIQNIFK